MTASADKGDVRGRPRIVTICGSTRFRDRMAEVNKAETLDGAVVLAPGVFAHADGTVLTEEQKAALDELHLRKIDMADEVIVVCPNNYIGASTRREIDYAQRVGKPLRMLADA